MEAGNDYLKYNNLKIVGLYQIFQTVELGLLCGFYYAAFTIRLFKYFTIGSFFFYIFIQIIYFYFHPEFSFSGKGVELSIESGLICVLVVLFFIQMLQINYKIELKNYTSFWLNSIHLIFYGGYIFTQSFSINLKETNPKLLEDFNHVAHFLNLFLYSAYIAVFIFTAKKPINSLRQQ